MIKLQTFKLWSRKQRWIGPYGLLALGLIVIACALRITLVSQQWPASNSDEATMGLMALHMARGTDFPVFFYGQSYMGSLEAALAAPLFNIFGASLVTLRLGMVLLFGLFLVVLYLLASLLYSRKLGLLSLVLLIFGSSEMFTRQLKAVGGAMETCLFGALALLLAIRLALTFVPDLSGVDRRRLLLYACLGGVFGLGIWSHMLVLPFVFLACVMLFLCCRPELGRYVWRGLIPGLLVGLLPLLIYNVQHPDRNSIVTLWQLHSVGGVGSSKTFGLLNFPWRMDLLGTISVSIPMTMGANPLCPMSTAPGAWYDNLQFSCIAFQASWGLGYILLLLLTCILAIRLLKRGHWLLPFRSESELSVRRMQVLALGRVILLASAVLTLLAYVSSPGPALVPITSERYLVGMLVATPAVLAPLSSAFGLLRRSIAKPLAWAAVLLSGAVIATVLSVLFMGTVTVFRQGPDVQADLNKHNALINYLLSQKISYFYSDYWHCNRLIFQSEEKVVCAVLNNDLTPGQDRYPLYPALVKRAPQAAYVFASSSDQAKNFAHWAAQKGLHYRSSTFLEFSIFQPTS